MLLAKQDSLSESSMQRGKRTIENLTHGADAFQKTILPPCFQKNAKTAFEYGPATTDTIATWVKMNFFVVFITYIKGNILLE